MTVEERINKALEPLDKLISRARRLLDHPDAVALTEAYENSPDKDKINFNNPK